MSFTSKHMTPLANKPTSRFRDIKKLPAKRYTAADRERLEKLYGEKGEFFNTFLFRLNGGMVFH